MGVDFLVGYNLDGPLPHMECFGEPSLDQALRHAILFHVRDFTVRVMAPNFRFLKKVDGQKNEVR